MELKEVFSQKLMDFVKWAEKGGERLWIIANTAGNF